ncbi:hypothetical protein [Bernardetia sp.]|uniref:hypothetical protein n=1 Tax=Bernardetia sp. TaxID=1937974 RepID=UPI0025BE6583|nr:hypothetical protein [Bernardetia sp.]
MTIHTLEKEKHSDFLSQNRIDPITGDILQEGDSVVICASCKSAFLADSWEYMGRRHCEQNITLQEVPTNEAVRIERSYLIDLDGIKVNASISEATTTMLPYSLSAYILCFILDYFYHFDPFWHVLNTANMFHFSSLWIRTGLSSYKSTLKIENNFLFFDKQQTEKNTLSAENIKNVEIYKSKRHSFMNTITSLFSSKTLGYTIKITSKNNLIYKLLLQQKEIERIAKETNLIQKFSKNTLAFLPTENQRSIQHKK